jgi:hypothetical protein
MKYNIMEQRLDPYSHPRIVYTVCHDLQPVSRPTTAVRLRHSQGPEHYWDLTRGAPITREPHQLDVGCDLRSGVVLHLYCSLCQHELMVRAFSIYHVKIRSENFYWLTFFILKKNK